MTEFELLTNESLYCGKLGPIYQKNFGFYKKRNNFSLEKWSENLFLIIDCVCDFVRGDCAKEYLLSFGVQ